MLRLRITIFFLTISFISFGKIGLADWSAKTPHGNEINNFSGETLYLKNGTQLEELGEWYFYKDFVIGLLGKDGLMVDTLGYFAVNEITFKIDTFKNHAEWSEFLVKNNLQPTTLTKWYESDWTNGDVSTFKNIAFLLATPFSILYLFLLYKAITKEKFKRSKPYTISVLSIAVLLFIIWYITRFS